MTYDDYLAAISSDDRRTAIDTVWTTVRAAVPSGFTEEISGRFLSFQCEGEWFVALAHQKSTLSLHFIPMYLWPEHRDTIQAAAPKLKCGKGCINFLRAEDLPLDAITTILSAIASADFLETIRRARKR